MISKVQSTEFVHAPNEGAFFSQARVLKQENGWTYSVDRWGRTIREKQDAHFAETIKVPFPVGADPAAIQFEPADLDLR